MALVAINEHLVVIYIELLKSLEIHSPSTNIESYLQKIPTLSHLVCHNSLPTEGIIRM